MTADVLTALDSSPVLSHLSQMKSFIEAADFSDWSIFNHAKKSFLNEFKAFQAQDKQKIWKEFTEIADSARAIKKHQEEEGEFAAEMIAKALDSHDVELQNMPRSGYRHALFDKVSAFKSVKDDAVGLLSSIKFLSVKASQLQALRQELNKTGMRLSIKGKLFDRLSKLGDAVFPVKKSFNSQLVENFFKGLEAFSKSLAKRDDGDEILFEIRVIQSFLKEMTLRKQEYDLIKATLDPLWKNALILKDKKELMLQEANAKSAEIKQSFEKEFENLKALVADGKDQDAMKVYDALSLKLKDRTLQKQDYRLLKNDLELASKPIFDRLKEQKDLRIELLKKQADEHQEHKNKFLETLSSLEASLEDKKFALNNALSLNLNVEEVYRFKLKFVSEALRLSPASEDLQELYVETKKIQESIRNLLAASSFDLGISLGLQDSYNDCKQLLTELLKQL
jgi:hypothetical protein